MEVQKNKDSYCISCCMDEQGLRYPVENQSRIEKLASNIRTDSNRNDPGTNNGTTIQIYGASIPPKVNTATVKEN